MEVMVAGWKSHLDTIKRIVYSYIIQVFVHTSFRKFENLQYFDDLLVDFPMYFCGLQCLFPSTLNKTVQSHFSPMLTFSHPSDPQTGLLQCGYSMITWKQPRIQNSTVQLDSKFGLREHITSVQYRLQCLLIHLHAALDIEIERPYFGS